jgi:hypothetical protein
VTDESVAQPGPGPVANWKVRTSVDVDPGKNPRVRVSPGRLQDHWAYPGCARFVPCDNLINCPGHLGGIKGLLVPARVLVPVVLA